MRRPKRKKSSDARKDRGNIFDDDSEEDYWGISEVYDDLDRADKTKLYFDLLDVFSKQLKKAWHIWKNRQRAYR